ncbi:MAG TPA: NADH-quinone oxidoreductase subunit J [Candidatus Hydrogenedentes bacterium]|nr:NADH-quinone oxidoreductase subunit J [Candidatus Hydrogenedentota bacterium]HOS02548.1 NADH-quinone oxidoreductase subunit J [Candidatus Hydrogenedentota bacterium]
MNATFYIAAAVAVFSTGMVVTRANAVHSLLYLVVSMLSLALVFFVLGAPLIAALEVVVYAGAIMVLFVFVVMMLNLGGRIAAQERAWLNPRAWRGPAALSAILFAELLYVLGASSGALTGAEPVQPKEIGRALFGPYMLAVELASMLLLAGLVGAFALARRDVPPRKERNP